MISIDKTKSVEHPRNDNSINKDGYFWITAPLYINDYAMINFSKIFLSKESAINWATAMGFNNIKFVSDAYAIATKPSQPNYKITIVKTKVEDE